MASMKYDFKVKTLSDERDPIFPSDNIELIQSLENAHLINGFDLSTYFPARFQDSNKKALFDNLIEVNKYSPSNQDVLITRFYPKPLPSIYTSEQHFDKSSAYLFIPNVFDYRSPDSNDIVEWHMNFANCDIFAYYDGSLLAQDELQVLESPQLASLREYLIQENNTKNTDKKVFSSYVVEKNFPYPILISNIERVINLNTTHLYGNNFSASSKATVLKSYKYLNPPQIINIIAIEAPKYGYGSYTSQQIEYILQACYTAYAAAKSLAEYTYKLNKQTNSNVPLKTYIHTGWFGCGAYGGNRTIMIILQILAAKMAGINRLTFHTVTDNCQQERRAADGWLKKLFDKNTTQLTKDEIIEKLLIENFQWGTSNGT